ncbi:heat shock protein 70 family protein [Tanacetum coccineum]
MSSHIDTPLPIHVFIDMLLLLRLVQSAAAASLASHVARTCIYITYGSVVSINRIKENIAFVLAVSVFIFPFIHQEKLRYSYQKVFSQSSGAEQLERQIQNLAGQHSDVLENLTSTVRKRLEFLKDIQKINSRHQQNLFSDNLDVTTTKYELHEAQERENMLAEQDSKVEQLKDQRNTLESFVYDTRSKSFATDTKKVGITKSLQETEDCLYEDSDDESDEQDYIGKLDDLKKIQLKTDTRSKMLGKISKTLLIIEQRTVKMLVEHVTIKQILRGASATDEIEFPLNIDSQPATVQRGHFRRHLFYEFP